MRKLLAAIVLFFVSLGAFGADLTQAQLSALKNDINANFLAQWNAQQIDTIVAAYNANASPAFTVWKTAVSAMEYRDAITWTEFTGRTAGERDMFSFLTGNGTMALECYKINVRQAVQDAFSGASGVNSRTALVALCKRPASRFEKLYTTGTGSDASPGQLGAEGPVSTSDIIAAMGQ